MEVAHWQNINSFFHMMKTTETAIVVIDPTVL